MKEVLTEQEIQQFIQQGFVCIENAFPREVADQCRDTVRKDTGCDPQDPSTWSRPIAIRMG